MAGMLVDSLWVVLKGAGPWLLALGVLGFVRRVITKARKLQG